MSASPLHLVRRALSSWSNHPLRDEERRVASSWLTSRELEIWNSMQPRDCRHSIIVQQRFAELCPGASRAEHAAALLHDVGKIESRLGWWMRIVATVVGPRGARFRSYHDHEKIGADLLRGLSDDRTVSLIAGEVDDDVAHALQRADDV